MSKVIYYQIKLNRKYLQGIKPNSSYSKTGRAPTMGNLHISSEYKTIWGDTPVEYEPLTAANYIKIIMEEFRWESRKESKILIIPTVTFT